MARTKGVSFVKIGKVISPFGKAKYPRLNEPDFKFKDDGEYRIQLILTPDEAEEFKNEVDALYVRGAELIEEEGGKVHKEKNDRILKEEIDRDTDEPTGNFEVAASMKATGTNKQTGKSWERRPQIVDSKKQILTERVWGGSIVRFVATACTYNNSQIGYGVKLYLEAVQVKELCQGADAADAFDEVEDGFETTTAAEGTTDADAGDASAF